MEEWTPEKLRELDVQIAEKVMNLFSEDRDRDRLGRFDRQDGCDDCKQDLVNCQVPNYSTDISAAWEVVGKMIEKNKEICLSYADGEWTVFPTWHSDSWPKSSSTITAPLAICLAALKGVEDE